jgi:hypothetical protein
MAYSDAASKILIKGAPFAYLLPINDAGTGFVETTTGTTDIIGLNNIGDPTIKVPASESSTSSAEYIDVTRCDGAIVRFTKSNVIIDGSTGNAFQEASGGGSDASGLGEITLIVNAAPVGGTGFLDLLTFSKFYQYMKNNQNRKFLVIVATGFTYTGSGANKVDGWAYMIGRLTNDLELTAGSGNAATLTLTFAANKATGTGMATAIDDELDTTGISTFPALTYYNNANSDATYTPVTIGAPSGDTPTAIATNLTAGKMEFTFPS